MTYQEQVAEWNAVRVVGGYEMRSGGMKFAHVTDAVAHPHFSHARAFQLGGTCQLSGRGGVYHRDPASPSGVMLKYEGDYAEIEAAVRQLQGTSPLSPTEGLGAR